jgi:hypothetical protein
LAQFELYEPELGQWLRTSPHIQMLERGRAQLASWESTSLTYLYSPDNSAAFTALIRALRLPETLSAGLMRRDQGTRYDYYWSTDPIERVEYVRLEGRELEIAYVNRRGRNRLRLSAAPLDSARRKAALDWLSRPETLGQIAQGLPLDMAAAAELGLIPAWDTLQVAATARAREALETGVQFACRALVVYPAFLPTLRELWGEAAIRRCVVAELTRRQAGFEAVRRALPAQAADFWARPQLPDLPAPHLVPPGPGLGTHLAPPRFWPRTEDNQLFADALTKVYKNIPRKLGKLTEARRSYL